MESIWIKQVLNIFSALLVFGLVSCKETDHKKDNMEQEMASDEETRFRPNFHFTPKEKWTNDPNGMFYHNGYYHLFYQHYPEESTWGPMHWGHAISTDMLQWRHMPIALYPDDLGHIWSGSAVVDHENTSGFGTPSSSKPVVAMYTNAKEDPETKKWFQTQSIAYSLDEGKTWVKYEGNPNIKNPGILDFRDPKMSWDAERERWLMVLAAGDRVMFYSSKDLKDWELLSEFGADLDRTVGTHGGVWECPDFFPLQVEGTDIVKWVLYLSINPGGPNGGSATEYFIGDFDGNNFVLDADYEKNLVPEKMHEYWIDFGRDNYAGVSWSDIPASDGRRIYLGWMSNWDYARDVPTESWRNGMTVPREVKLIRSGDTYKLAFTPVRELAERRGKKYKKDAITVDQEVTLLEPGQIDLTKAEIKFEMDSVAISNGHVFKLKNAAGDELAFGFDGALGAFFVDRSKSGIVAFSEKFPPLAQAPRTSANPTLNGTLILDKTSIELFWDDGETVMTEIFFPNEPFERMTLSPQEDGLTLEHIEINELNFN